ncbi:hypothetical protein E4U41_001248, partial [Claviceps citrina]
MFRVSKGIVNLAERLVIWERGNDAITELERQLCSNIVNNRVSASLFWRGRLFQKLPAASHRECQNLGLRSVLGSQYWGPCVTIFAI